MLPRALIVVLGLLVSLGCQHREETDSRPTTHLRRLTRTQYANSIRDLLGTELEVARWLPADDHGHGFDTMSNLLTVSPELLAAYELAVDEVVERAIDDPTSWSRIVPCEPDPIGEEACARDALLEFASNAWRRPVEEDELQPVLRLVQDARASGESFESSMGRGLRVILLSPHFVFRVETAPSEASEALVSDWEMASRLSYFLWSSLPDAELAAAARAGRLQSGEDIEAQVRRMLEDEKAISLVDDFAGQWLYIRALDGVFKDVTRYPRFDEALRDSMREEMRLFFGSLLWEDRDFRELLTSDSTFVDSALMSVYGISTPPFEGFREQTVSFVHRSGILTMPGLLSVLARPFRTAPAKRGAWVLGQLLCAPPPPPPAFAEGLEPGAQNDPACRSCHDRIDPIGYALESYDGMGMWRSRDENGPIDPSGRLEGLGSFDDAVELAERIAEDPAFIDCAIRQVLTYALGRGLTSDDDSTIRSIARAWERGGFRTQDLFILVSLSHPMRTYPGNVGAS